METTSKESLTTEEILLDFIHDLFDCRKLPQHLIFLDYWMEKVLINKLHKKKLNVSDLVFFSDKFLRLFGACYEIYNTKENVLYFEECIKIPKNFINKERESLVSYPSYLRIKEICNPMLVFHSIFKQHSLSFYNRTLQKWVNEGLSQKSDPENVNLIFPIYRNLKRMIEACWLIHERYIRKNSYESLSMNATNLNFSLSCPLLLNDEYQSNPYLQVESFFSFADINEYKHDLTQWFKVALNDQQGYENPNDLLFIHNQFTQLIHAGYLIGISQFVYEPELNYTPQHATFGHWLLARMKNQYSIQLLSSHFKENPIDYCRENLTLSKVTKLRYGLKEWLESALSKNSSIIGLDHPYLFDQFEDLQKTLEALFLLIIEPTLTD